jgi:hypothetical protein
MAYHRRLLLQSDEPMPRGQSRSGHHGGRVRLYDLFQYGFLFRLEIDKKDVLAFAQGFFEAREIVVRPLDSKQAALPRAKSEHYDGEENDRHPTGSACRPSGKISEKENQHKSANPDEGAAHRQVDDDGAPPPLRSG